MISFTTTNYEVLRMLAGVFILAYTLGILHGYLLRKMQMDEIQLKLDELKSDIRNLSRHMVQP